MFYTHRFKRETPITKMPVILIVEKTTNTQIEGVAYEEYRRTP